jgi:hypothetical protein
MFFYSLPIFFDHIRAASPLECLVMALALFGLLYISVPVAEKKWLPFPYDNYLLTAWLGNASLAWVFWPFFMVLNIGLGLTDWLVKSAHITVSSWDDIHFAFFLGVIWWFTSVWRCASNTEWRLFAAFSRFACVAVLLEFALVLYIRIYYPRIFFNCEEALLDYSSCF